MLARLSSDAVHDAPPPLDDVMAETRRLLSLVDRVSATELRALARKLRVLATYAEGWAQRMEQAESI